MVVRKWETATMRFYREARSVIVSRRRISSKNRVETKRQPVVSLFPLRFHFTIPVETKWKYVSAPLPLLYPLCFHLPGIINSNEGKDSMPTKPYQSRLIPYEEEIMRLRRRRPPMTYARIAQTLQQKYNLVIHQSAICKFIKVRKRGRKVYGYSLSQYNELLKSN
jgi:hypothetical protein